MGFNKEIFDLFKKAFESDASFIESWMVNWTYQDVRKKRKVNYKGDLPEDFYTFENPQDIVEWMNWLKTDKPVAIQSDIINPLIEKSELFDRNFFKQFDLKFDFDGYQNGIARNNGQDYVLANILNQLNLSDTNRVLDFGSGYGRQANLWNQMNDENYVHISVDAIPKSYCLQHLYYSSMVRPNFDYVIDKNNFKIDQYSKGIYHLPTWRMDLIPDNYLDKILVVQVLPELNEKLVKYIIKEFRRILKPNGLLYIRDHGNSWRPGNKLNIDKYILEEGGFSLEYKMHAIDRKDFHGIPRIFRITKEVVKAQEKVSSKQIFTEFVHQIDAGTNGKLKSVIKKILRK